MNEGTPTQKADEAWKSESSEEANHSSFRVGKTDAPATTIAADTFVRILVADAAFVEDVDVGHGKKHQVRV